MENELSKVGVNGNLDKSSGIRTGTCAVVVVNKERTLVANVSAASKYSSEHLHNNMETLSRAKLIYSTGFFLLTNASALLEIAKYANDNDIPFVFNLSAVFIMDVALDSVLATLKHADIVFANEDECDKFA